MHEHPISDTSSPADPVSMTLTMIVYLTSPPKQDVIWSWVKRQHDRIIVFLALCVVGWDRIQFNCEQPVELMTQCILN